MFISMSFTRNLTTCGLPSGRLLNSSLNAPLVAQTKGIKKVLVFRWFLLLLVAALSVLYKFSFTSVDARDLVAVDASTNPYDFYGTEINGDYTPIGESDILRLYPYNQVTDSSLPPEVLSANLVDFMTGSNSSVTYATNATYRFKASGERLDVIIGPKFNDTRLS